MSVPTPEKVYLFHEGSYYRSYETMGAHVTEEDGRRGVRFTVWAPHAREVRLASDFNHWDGHGHSLERMHDSGIWSGFFEGLGVGTVYKYEIITPHGGKILKADPFAFFSELRPRTASVVTELEGYRWNDAGWMKSRKTTYDRPQLIYEVHLGSWKKKDDGEFLTYRELADELIDWVAALGYTHIELLPLTEHPYDRSWGYQATGYYSVTSRYGSPHDFMYFVDRCHSRNIGVIMDWVPGHFTRDAHGLREFDGEPCFEHPDPMVADRPGWGTLGFDYGRPEVRSFLISNAIFWMDKYHIDGLRVDAVTSMVRLDFEKSHGQWRPNDEGGVESKEAVSLLRKLNEEVFISFPNALMMAEESSAWPLVTSPIELGGLGFNYKWNMGWMNDTLKYFETDPIARKHHQNLLTFPIAYAWSENYTLPFSHDEVVHGKRSLLNKMPGDIYQKFAGLRTLLGYWITFPGKKLLFMGSEFGQFDEWKDETELDWFLLKDYDTHRQMLDYTKRLNEIYLSEKALWQQDHRMEGYEWIDHRDHDQNIIVYMRHSRTKGDFVVAVCNFSPVGRSDYRIGVPSAGTYAVLLNSDDERFGGTGAIIPEAYETERIGWHDRKQSLSLTIPPMSVLLLKRTRTSRTVKVLSAAAEAPLPAEKPQAQAKRSRRKPAVESGAQDALTVQAVPQEKPKRKSREPIQ